MRHLAAPKVARPQELHQAPVCGIPHPVTPQLELPRQVGIPPDMPLLVTVGRRPVCARIVGTRLQRQKEVFIFYPIYLAPYTQFRQNVFKSLFCVSETPGHGSGWAETPRTDRGEESAGETPTPGASKRKSRWDETPASQMGSSTPLLTPGKTPLGTPAMNMATPTPGTGPVLLI